jgi:hypothetical protein
MIAQNQKIDLHPNPEVKPPPRIGPSDFYAGISQVIA